ncbi:MAG: DUF983 domain-containing protein [Actinomycetota bacterium]
MQSDAARTSATPLRRITRALVRRCPRCGARGIFRSYLQLRDRCPSCEYEFAAEEGFFLGVWVLNFAVSKGLLFLTLVAYIFAMAATGGGVPLLPAFAAGLVVALGGPLVFYPFAASTWAAVELIMDPTRAR